MEPTVSKANKPKNRNKAPTVHDVATLAGVSAQTVSRVVNDSSHVAESTRLKVESAIKQLGYIPNSLARSLVSRGAKSIGLIVTDSAQGFFPDTTRAIEEIAARNGYTANIITAYGQGEQIRDAIEHFRTNQFAGVIVNAVTREFEKPLQDAAQSGFPVVLMHRTVPGIESIVKWDGYEKGARLAVEHLLSIGCKKIAFLATRNDELVDTDKLDGYRNALADADISFDPTLVIKSPHDFEGGYTAMSEALHVHPDIDGVFVTSDVRAVGALRSLALNQIRVPEDIAIVAFGGSTMANMVTPSLSTIRVPRKKLGELAATSLMDLIEGESPKSAYVYDQPTLEIGESSLRTQSTLTPGREPPNAPLPNGN